VSAEPIESPVPVCEACWVKENAEWEPESMDGNGNILMKLRGIPTPKKYDIGTVESCDECGAITVVGIYKFKKHEITFPHQDDL
jgi:hypothetical protein